MNSPSVTTSHFAIQSPLIERHRKTLEWLSAIALWKRELAFLQKLIDHYGTKGFEFKYKLDHYQNILLYYREKLVDSIASQLQLHERKLAQLVANQNEKSTDYFLEHVQIMSKVQALGAQIRAYREEIYNLIEQIIDNEAAS